MHDEKSRACASCKGINLVLGRILSQGGVFFLPAGRWFGGYTPKAYTCLDCGYVGLYLIQRDIESLREKELQKSE
jgi:hypothetical protein